MSGDVIELPHLIDEYALNDLQYALRRFYVVEDVNRAAEGFSHTWYPHLYRLKLKQIYDSQEYADILDQPAAENENDTLRDLISSCATSQNINQAIISQAEADAAKSGYDISHYYTLAVDENGKPIIRSSDSTEIDSTPSDHLGHPDRVGYDGYLIGLDEAPNGAPFGSGISFPTDVQDGDYFLRTDFRPQRLFKYDGTKWRHVIDDVRLTLTNTDERMTYKNTFVNNTNTNTIGGEEVKERQSLSKALRPKADN